MSCGDPNWDKLEGDQTKISGKLHVYFNVNTLSHPSPPLIMIETVFGWFIALELDDLRLFAEARREPVE